MKRYLFLFLLFTNFCFVGSKSFSAQYPVNSGADIRPLIIVDNHVATNAAIKPTKLAEYDPTGQPYHWFPCSDGAGHITWCSTTGAYLPLAGGTMLGDILADSTSINLGSVLKPFGKLYSDQAYLMPQLGDPSGLHITEPSGYTGNTIDIQNTSGIGPPSWFKVTSDGTTFIGNDLGLFDPAGLTTRTDIFAGSATPNGNATANPGAFYLRTNGEAWLKVTGTGTNTGWLQLTTTATAGTVSSIDAAVPVEFTLSGVPFTTSGTITIGKALENAHYVWIGPSSGSPAQPTFRALVASDLPAGTGTVTSIGLTAPGEITITGSPITTSGTINLAWTSQAANLFFASPDGSSGVPSFRSIVAADLPVVGSSGSCTNCNLSIDTHGIVTSYATGAGGTGGRSFTIYLAADDSSSAEKALADHVCAVDAADTCFASAMSDIAARDVTTTLSGTITNIATALTVASSTGFPNTPFWIWLDNEFIEVTNVSGTTWTIVRAQDNTAAAPHTTGHTIYWLASADIKLAAGNYTSAAGIAINHDYVRILGAGTGTVLIRDYNGGPGDFFVNAAGGIRSRGIDIENLAIRGGSTETTNNSGIVLTASHSRVHNCWFSAIGGDSLLVNTGTSFVEVSDNFFNGLDLGGGWPFDINGDYQTVVNNTSVTSNLSFRIAANHSTVTGNNVELVDTFGPTGIQILGNNNNVANNHIHGGDYSYRVTGNNNTIIGNSDEGPSVASIYVNGTSNYIGPNYFVSIPVDAGTNTVWAGMIYSGVNSFYGGAVTWQFAPGAGAGKCWTSDASGFGSWQTCSGGFSNPMSAAGDFIVGGSSGTPTRFAANSTGTKKFLNETSSTASWNQIDPGDLTSASASSGDCLKWNGSAWAPSSCGGGGGGSGGSLSSSSGLTFLKSTTVSNATDMHLTGWKNSSAYDMYVIKYYGVLPRTDNTSSKFQVSTDGGSTYQATNYAWTGGESYIGGYIATGADSGQTGIYFTISQGNASNKAAFGSMDINQPSSDYMYFNGSSRYKTYLTNQVHLDQAGEWQSTTAVDAIRIVAETGNIDGTMAIYGVAKSAPTQGLVYTATADATVANTTTETTIIGSGSGSLTLPADSIIVGKTYRIRAKGYVTDTSTPTLNIKVKMGSTVLVSTGATTLLTGLSNSGWQLDVDIVGRTTGVSGTVTAQGSFNYGLANLVPMVSTSTSTIDTTTTQTLDVTATWGTADPSNTITAPIITVEALN